MKGKPDHVIADIGAIGKNRLHVYDRSAIDGLDRSDPQPVWN